MFADIGGLLLADDMIVLGLLVDRVGDIEELTHCVH